MSLHLPRLEAEFFITQHMAQRDVITPDQVYNLTLAMTEDVMEAESAQAKAILMLSKMGTSSRTE